MGFYYFYENHRVEEIDYQTFFNKWKNKDSFILVVSKTKCPYCQLYLPKVEDIAKKYKIKVYYVNTDNFTADESNSFSSYIDYQGSTPTTVFITNGEEKSKLSRIHGNVKYEKIIEKFEKQINLDENEANKLYEIVMRIIGTEIKNKLKHPFKSQD